MVRDGRSAAPTITIYDVAAAAEVSISTVSLVLNDPSRVAPTTRSRVLQAVDNLGFVPKAEAVSRARQGVGLVGVLAPFSSYASYYRRLNGFTAELALADRVIDTVIFDHASAAITGSPLLSSVPLTHRLDGLVVMGLPIDDLVAERIHNHGLPTILIDTSRRDFSCVVTDDYAGGKLAAERVIARGHQRVAYVSENKEAAESVVLQGDLRMQGFREALGADAVVDVVLVSHDPTAARDAVHTLLDSADPPTAIAAHDDTLASGAMWALRERGVVPGTDVDVVGFDDSDVAQALGLTTVAQPFEESGATAAAMIRDLLNGTRATRRRVELDVALVVRSSG